MKLPILSGFFLLLLSLAQPAYGYQRVALIVDLWSPSGSSVTRNLMKELTDQHGFDVILAIDGRKDVSQDLAAFTSRSNGSEIALVVLVGPLDHDSNGTAIQLVPKDRDGQPQSIGLTQLFDQLVQNAKSALVVLQGVDKPASKSGRISGPGRLPMIGNKLQIAFAPPAVTEQGAIIAALLAEAILARERTNFDPQSWLAATRDRHYLETFGQNVVLMFGSLPAGIKLVRPPIRSELIERIWERTKTLCSSEFSNAPSSEQKLLSSLASSVNGLRSSKFSDNDTFTLELVFRFLDDRRACPFATPELPPATAPARPPEKVKPSEEDSGKKRQQPDPPDAPAPRPAKPSAEPENKEEPKKQPPKPEKKRSNDDDDPAPSKKQPAPAPKRAPPPEPKSSPEPKSKPEPKSSPPSPSKGTGGVPIPF
ncbi:MAG: hypothetical protein ABL901_00300 [Hyphomicrobiaceae bacterium]